MVKIDINNWGTKTIHLEEIPWAEVVVRSVITVWQQIETRQKFPNMSDINHADAINGTMYLVKNSIISWNLEWEEWPIEVNEENLKKLPSECYTSIVKATIPATEKKN